SARIPQVARVEPLGEQVVDGAEKLPCLGAIASISQQARKIGRCTKPERGAEGVEPQRLPERLLSVVMAPECPLGRRADAQELRNVRALVECVEHVIDDA